MQAVNLAACFGVSRIILIGFDMNLRAGSHWHGDHGKGLTNPSLTQIAEWADAMDGAAGQLAAIGVSVINASLTSALKNYPKMTLSEAVTEFRI